ncbi:MAG: hypothetical protein JW867_03445 [Candidatus Omnitrophica bacterium]|nr:hypothetical protein [Candidatus Omnitrophota bacterium]
MKSIFKAVLLLWFLIFFSNSSYAYRPVNITAEADLDQKTIFISVQTQTNTPHKNYIRRIALYLEKKPPLVKNFFFQKRGYYQQTTFANIDFKNLENITVKAYVHTGGSLERTFKIDDILKKENP